MASGLAKKWSDFLAPKYWSTWLVIGFLRVLGLLPFAIGSSLGRGLGSLLYYMAKRRRHIVEVNIRLCFPELNEQEHSTLVKKVMQANAVGIVDAAWAYWGNIEKIKSVTTLKGFDLIARAQEKGKGVILLGAHFSTLDLGGLLFSFSGQQAALVYRQHNNPLMDYMICKKRSRFSRVIERKKFRDMLRTMRNNQCLWYAPDQDFGAKGAVFVPFFGQTAATITATTNMIGLNDSPIVMLSHHRRENDEGYIIEASTIDGLPSGNEEEDARIINQAIEREVRKAPEQYMWVHRRFKTQPDGRHKLYGKQGKKPLKSG